MAWRERARCLSKEERRASTSASLHHASRTSGLALGGGRKAGAGHALKPELVVADGARAGDGDLPWRGWPRG